MTDVLITMGILAVIVGSLYIMHLHSSIAGHEEKFQSLLAKLDYVKKRIRVREEAEYQVCYPPRGDSKRSLRYRIVAEAFYGQSENSIEVEVKAVISDWDLPDVIEMCHESQFIRYTNTTRVISESLDVIKIKTSVRGWDWHYDSFFDANEAFTDFDADSDDDMECTNCEGRTNKLFEKSNDFGFSVDILRCIDGLEPVSLAKIHYSLLPIVRQRQKLVMENQRKFREMIKIETEKPENKTKLMNFGPPPPDDFFSLDSAK